MTPSEPQDAPPVDLAVLMHVLAQTWRTRADRYASGPSPDSWDETRSEVYRRVADELTALLPSEEIPGDE